MNLLTLFKKNNLDELFLSYLSRKINVNDLTQLSQEMFVLHDGLLDFVENIKKSVKIQINEHNTSTSTIKKIVKLLSYTKMTSNYFEFLHIHLSDINISNKKAAILRVEGILESINEIEAAIVKDTYISKFVNELMKSEDKSKYKVGLALIQYFRTDLKGDIRNSLGKYKIDILDKNINNSLKAFSIDERNLFIVSLESYKQCGKKLKERLNLNKENLGREKYFIKYTPDDLDVVMMDTYMKENHAFNTWLNKVRKNIEVEDILNNFEKKIINFNKTSKSVFGENNYITYKLNYNHLINSVDKAVAFYENTFLSVEKTFKFDNKTVQEKKDILNTNRKNSIEKLNKVFKEEERIKIEKVIKNSLLLLGNEFDFTSTEIKKMGNSQEKYFFYQVQYKKKNINLIFNVNLKTETNCSQMSPYYEKDNLSPNYLINIDISESEYQKNSFSLENLKLLFHELGHFVNMIYSNHGDIEMCKMENVEMPSTFMEEILFQKHYLEKIIGKVSDETYGLILMVMESIKKQLVFRFLIEGYVHNKIFAGVKRKGDLKKTLDGVEKFLEERGIVWNKHILFENDINQDSWGFSYNKFDYINVNFSYLLGFMISKKMRENKISMKKAFTNLFNYDMIKIDQCHWSKYVDFN